MVCSSSDSDAKSNEKERRQHRKLRSARNLVVTETSFNSLLRDWKTRELMSRRTPDSSEESGTDNEPDQTTATAHTESFSVRQSRDTKLPSMIEKTAMFIDRAKKILEDQPNPQRQ